MLAVRTNLVAGYILRAIPLAVGLTSTSADFCSVSWIFRLWSLNALCSFSAGIFFFFFFSSVYIAFYHRHYLGWQPSECIGECVCVCHLPVVTEIPARGIRAVHAPGHLIASNGVVFLDIGMSVLRYSRGSAYYLTSDIAYFQGPDFGFCQQLNKL